MTRNSVSATDAKQQFGKLIDDAQRGPVTITSHNRAIAVVVSAEEYAADQLRKRKSLEAAIVRGCADIAAGRFTTVGEDWKLELPEVYGGSD